MDDHGEALDREQARAQDLLAEIRTELLDLVEEVEALKAYHKAMPDAEIRTLIEANPLREEVEQVMPVLARSIIKTISPEMMRLELLYDHLEQST